MIQMRPALIRSHVRIKLFFTQALGHKVYRDRGVSNCWYLVPTSCKRIADVMYHISETFDLMAFCPNGIQLSIDDVYVPPEEDVRLLRENDAIVVGGFNVTLCDFDSNDNAATNDTASPCSRYKGHQSIISGKRSKKKEKKKDGVRGELVALAKALSLEKVERDRNRTTKTLKRKKPQQVQDRQDVAEMGRQEIVSKRATEAIEERSKTSSEAPLKKVEDNENLSVKKGRKRPSRRQRQAKRRRLEMENACVSSTAPAVALITQENNQQTTNTAEPDQTRFIPATQATMRRECQHHIQSESFERETSVDGHVTWDSDDAQVDKDEERPQWKEWKRPYEVIASVEDKVSRHLNPETDQESLSIALQRYPTSPAPQIASTYHVDDIVAYQTLTLCSDTWQPVQSDWQCGRVCSVESSDEKDGGTLQVEKHTLAFRDSLQWSSENEMTEISLSEIHQLRFLHGPSYIAAESTELIPDWTC